MNINKITKLFFIIVSIVSAYNSNCNAQNSAVQNPSVSSLLSFEDNPVDLYTGIPEISVPLYSMPTRSKDININLSLNYHPSSVSEFNKDMGDTGRGWNLTTGGAISRTINGKPDELTYGTSYQGNSTEESNDIYNFNFLGHTGKFVVTKSGTTIAAYFTEGPGDGVFIDLLRDSSTSLVATGFRFYDVKGYIYDFTAADVFYYGSQTYNSSYQLTSIRDNNNNVLATYTYTNNLKHESYHAYNQNNLYKFLSQLDVPGFGKIVYFNGWNDLFGGNGLVLYTGIEIYDVFNNLIKQFEFHFNTIGGATYTGDDIQLIQVEEKDVEGLTLGSYKMYYKQKIPTETYKKDFWGYPTITNDGCDESSYGGQLPDPENCNVGVLEKLVLPTGGCIIYKFEVNTFSGDAGEPMDFMSYDAVTDTYTYAPNYFKDFLPTNFHNYTKNIIASKNFSTASPSALSIPAQPAGTKLYFQVDGDRYLASPGLENPGGPSNWIYPHFYLFNNTTNTTTDITSQNGDNECLGYSKQYENNAGYTLSMSGANRTSGWGKVYTFTLNPVIKKWWYGSGLRIKKLGYFADQNVPQNYYDTTSDAVPSKEFTYGYNMPWDANRSSGGMENSGDSRGKTTYKYVTVTPLGNIGKTEYTFNSWTENGAAAEIPTYKIGKLRTKKVFDKANVLQQQTDYNYTDIVTGVVMPGTNAWLRQMGWAMPDTIVTRNVLGAGNVTTTETFSYNLLRKLSEKTVTTNGSNKVLKEKYFYHTLNSTFSKGRIDIDHVEQYFNDELTATTKSIYSNVWNNLQGTLINQSYLTQQLQSAKTDKPLETKARVNFYDTYGHPVEVQKENGTKTVTVWGYDDSQVIATIENIGYAQITASLITDIKTASNSILPNAETTLITKLKALRDALPNAMVTTYTYKPLIGVSTVTDPKGYTIYYDYDTAGRLIAVKEIDPVTQNFRLLSENKYNYKP